MSEKICEFDLRLPVARWLLARGLSPIVECGCLNNCDMIGVRFVDEKPRRIVEMVAVELKLYDVTGVLDQCTRHRRNPISEVWAAMRPDIARREAAGFARLNIGMLAVTPETCEVVVPAVACVETNHARWVKPLHRRRDEHLKRMKNHQMRHQPIATNRTPIDFGF